MKYVNNVLDALKEGHSLKKYFFVTLAVAFFLFLFNTLVNNYRILFSNFSFSLLFSLLKGTLASMTSVSIVLLVIMSVLAGVVISMTLFLVQRQIKGSIGASTSGILVSLIAPACPSCAIGLLSVLGIGGFLAFLPFKGLELGFFGIGLLGVSTVYLSNKITTKTCSIAQQGDSTMEGNNISIKKSTLWKGAAVVLIIVLGFFTLREFLGGGLTGNVVATGDTSIQSAKLFMRNYEYQVEPAVLKKGIPVRMTVDVDSLPGCARGVVIKDFGIRKSVSKVDNVIEFTPDKTGTVGIACSMNMYRGTFIVLE